MSRITRVAAVFVTIFLFSLLGAASLRAEILAQMPRPPRDDTPLHFQPLPFDTYRQLARPAAPLATAGYGDWSKVVFQSYRDGNWEIYIANGDGTGQTRLTANTASDTYPRLNRGGTRIVFDSNRTGIYEIYTMNPDGSGLSQVTASTNNNYDPAWSPDGSKIAFESFRDGQAEIYVMNANGTALTRLTNNPAFDGHPTWSPDGTKIAFTSDRGTPANTGNRVWVMNADGSSPQQLTAQSYCQNPNWSPDGTRIAFDADATNDGSQEIWLMNANGSGQMQVYDPPDESPLGYPGLTDAWVRSWSPDGNFIAFTRLTWIYYQGAWYWYTGYLDAVDTASFSAFRLVSTQGDDWYPDWVTLDINAPGSSVQALTQYSRAAGTNIKWLGQDAGLAGIMNYDVQYRLGTGGSWMNWLTTAATTSVYTGTPGTTVYFRSRARDNAGNLEAWPNAVNGDAHTTFYTQQLNGNVTDNRGVPLPHVSIPITPSALNIVDTDRAGRFTAYLPITGPYTFVPHQVGYGVLPTSTLNANADRSIDLHLPPVDDVIQNGGFENSSTVGWESIGITPTIQPSAAHTGQSGAVLGQSFPQPPSFQVSSDNLGAQLPAMAYDLTGTLHIVWSDRVVPSHIHYAGCAPQHACESVQLPFEGTLPKIAIGPDGVVHLIYIQNNWTTIMYANRAAGTWSAAQSIGTSGGGAYNGSAAIAVDSQSRPHIVWNDNQMIYYSYRQNATTWTSLVQISDNGVTPAIAISSNDDVHVVWSSWSWTSYRHKLANGDWEASIPLYQSAYPTAPAIAVDHDNQPHLAWVDTTSNTHIVYTHRHTDGTWSSQSTIPATQIGYDAKLVVGLDNAVIVAWHASWNFAYLSPDGATWSTALSAFDPALGEPDFYNSWTAMALHPTTGDLALATLVSVNGIWQVHATEFQPPIERTKHSSLRQIFHLPIDLHHPILSVLYQYTSEEEISSEPFSISIDDGAHITTVLTQTDSIGWTHAWLDVEPWRDRTITLTLDVSGTVANGRYSWATIDEVSLGSWLTPWPIMVTPDQIEAGVSAVITFTGDNFLAVPQLQIGDNLVTDVHWIDTTTLTATVPALAFGQYEVRVTNPGGQANAAPRNLIVGNAIYLPVVTKSPF